MGMIRKATLTVILVLACLGTALAQTTLNSTTTSAALSVTGQVVSLTSVTNISADDGLFMDREFMRVQSCNTTALTCLVTRGQQGTSARAHASGVVVYSGAYQRFTKAVPVGVCTATAEEFLPRIVLPAGDVYQCSNSEWVRYRNAGYRVFHPGRSDGGTTYTANGAITPQPGFSFINGTTLAMTLANPTTEQNGMIMVIIATNASAHTVTYTAGFNGGTTARDVATFGGAVGDNIQIQAFNGVWWVISTRNVTLA